MKKKIILLAISGVSILLLSAATIVNQNGVADWTGSPVDGGTGAGGTCLNCHSGQSGTAPTISVTTSPALAVGNKYTPSQVYTVTISGSGSKPAYGVNCEIINSQSTSTGSVAMFGTFGAAVTSNTKIYALSSTTPYPPCVSHTSPSSSGTFSFKWTAPASGTGYLYAILLNVNNDGGTGGDKQSAVTTLTLTPAPSAGIEDHSETNSNLSVFPNPATDNVRLTYTLIERSNVTVKLMNLNGEVVADLLNETQHQGPQSVDTRLPMGLAKGMYMVKLSINGKQTMQKLIVL